MSEIKPNLRRLRAERVAQGYDQGELANKIGMCRVSYWKKENGIVAFTINELAKIMTVLGLDKDKASMFFTQEDSEKSNKED